MKVRVLSWTLVLLLHGLVLAWLAGTFTAPTEPAQALPILAVDMVAPETQAEPQTPMPPPRPLPPPAPVAPILSEKSAEIPKKKTRTAKILPKPVRPAQEAVEESTASPSLPLENVLPPSAQVPDIASSLPPTTAQSAPPNSAKPVTTAIYIPADYAAGNRPPDYPALSRRYQEEGTVILRVLVRADGRAGQIEVGTSSGYPLLDQAARQAVQSWRFAPATNNGQAVSDWFLLPIRFTLHE